LRAQTHHQRWKDHHYQRHRHAGMGAQASAGGIAAAQSLPDTNGCGERQADRQHKGQRREVDRDLMRGHGHIAKLRHQQTDSAEQACLHEDAGADRQSHSEGL
jgi:hypothetical protein